MANKPPPIVGVYHPVPWDLRKIPITILTS